MPASPARPATSSSLPTCGRDLRPMRSERSWRRSAIRAWAPSPATSCSTANRVGMAGYGVVFEERACAFDRTASDASAEGRRKLRTLAGNYQLLWLEPRLLLPWANPAWLQFMSHKVGRLLVPYALPAVFVLSLALARHSAFYGAAFG